jgi:putative spermidine/putrescine transport system permease protein
MSLARTRPAVTASRPRAAIRPRKLLGLLGRTVFAVLLVGFIAAPLLGILSTSITTTTFWEFPPTGATLRWYARFLQTGELVGSTYVSIGAALLVAVVGPALATLIALALTRTRIRRTTRDMINVGILIPLLVPTIALGLAIYLLYILANIPVNLVTLAAAQLILVLPLTTGLMATGLEGIRPNVERAAANLGAGTATILGRVTLPLVRPALIAAAIIAFVRSFDDSSVALFINSPATTTLPIRMLLEMQEAFGPLIAAAGCVLLLIAVVLAVVLDRVIGLGRAFGIADRR